MWPDRQLLWPTTNKYDSDVSTTAAVSAPPADDGDGGDGESSDSDSVESFEDDDNVESLRARIRAQRDDFAETLDNLEALFDAEMQKRDGE